MGEIGRVQRPDPAINAPNLLGRVLQAGDQKHGRQHEDERPPKEDVVELHDEEAPPPSESTPYTPPESAGGGLDLAV